MEYLQKDLHDCQNCVFAYFPNFVPVTNLFSEQQLRVLGNQKQLFSAIFKLFFPNLVNNITNNFR